MRTPELRFVVCEDDFNGCKYEVVLRDGHMRPVFSWRRHIQKNGKRVRYGWKHIEADTNDLLLLELASSNSPYVQWLVFGLKVSINWKVTLRKLAESGTLGQGFMSYEPRAILVRESGISLYEDRWGDVLRVMRQHGWVEFARYSGNDGVMIMLTYERKR